MFIYVLNMQLARVCAAVALRWADSEREQHVSWRAIITPQ